MHEMSKEEGQRRGLLGERAQGGPRFGFSFMWAPAGPRAWDLHLEFTDGEGTWRPSPDSSFCIRGAETWVDGGTCLRAHSRLVVEARPVLGTGDFPFRTSFLCGFAYRGILGAG